MKKIITRSLFLICSNICFSVWGQQTPMFAHYDYNTVSINPAHAGYYPDTDITLTNNGYFNQLEGSPRNIGVSVNSPVGDKNMGLGAGFIADEVGVTKTTNLFLSYAYKIVFDHNYNRARWWSYNPNVLSFGMTTGALFYNENLVSLGIQDDPNFTNNTNTTIPTMGVGVLYNHEHIYIGFSAPNVLGTSFASDKDIELENVLYAYGGYRFFATHFQEVMMKPNVLFKYVSGAPAQVDLNFTVNYKNRIEAGIGYRTSESINFLAGFYMFNHFRVLYTYNQALRSSPINNSHGIVLSYRLGEGFVQK
ncbi:PorP/SprF family type IX secretion system membrane protein [Aquimarina pacifica]|uniref:PorP/SprF family type IX secretion system membrane protein n=1 Tax=Aquimarina pacifica TaxID=1296415 RepID=UPI00054F9B33|nr:PorP/SprF family type IX secretion system membrane protein [Aquimarina pacifica]